jgi:predicted GIY-YIG superfamily endonuclease
MYIGEVRGSTPLISTKLQSKTVKKQQHTKGYVYILKSIPNSGYYIGSTIDIQKRFNEHNNGYVKSTRNLRPLELKYFKMYDDIKTVYN